MERNKTALAETNNGGLTSEYMQNREEAWV
jgi:hypothetical protein